MSLVSAPSSPSLWSLASSVPVRSSLACCTSVGVLALSRVQVFMLVMAGSPVGVFWGSEKPPSVSFSVVSLARPALVLALLSLWSLALMSRCCE